MPHARPFFDVAREIRHGMFLEDCAAEMQKMVAAVDETGKSAKLIIEVTVTPAARVGGAVKIADKVTSKLPALPAGETIMFMTPENNLVANDPKQQSLELKAVTTTNEAQLQQVNAG